MRNDTEHLLSSPRNSERLKRAIEDMNRGWNATLQEEIPEEWRRLLDKLI
jgi:PHD/YefM family antitoxin component YafN of YafNO toxin-antitoxin module